MSESYVKVAGSVTPKDQDPIDIAFNVACDAVTKIEYEIAAAASDVELVLTGVTDDDNIKFVLLTLDSYTEAVAGTADVTYRVALVTNTQIQLGEPNMYSPGMDEGLGAAGLIFDSIWVSNADPAVAKKLTVVIGYDIA